MCKRSKNTSKDKRKKLKRAVSSICKFTLKVNNYRKKKAESCKRKLREDYGFYSNRNSPHNTTQYIVNQHQHSNELFSNNINETKEIYDIDIGIIPHREFELTEEEQRFLFDITDSNSFSDNDNSTEHDTLMDLNQDSILLE